MSYTLQALLGDAIDVKDVAPTGAVVVVLPQSMALMPLTHRLLQELVIAPLPLTDGGELPRSVESLADGARKPIAYVEAELFGGAGTQAAVVWQAGKVVLGPVVARNAINQALRFLGVMKEGQVDEFEALGLGRHRDTNKWV